MNIGVFTIMLHSGGTERVIAKLSLLWSSLGHRVHFFTIRQPHDAEFTHKCVLRECAPEGRWTVADADRLHEECRLDLVVFNGGWNNAWIETLVCRFKQMNVHTIAILHHSFNNWAFAGCNEGDFDKERLLSHLDCLVCVDRMQALWWSRRCPNVAYIPNPCALEIQRSSLTDKGGKRNGRIVWVGRADDQGKRVDLAIAVLQNVRKRIPEVELTIVGALPKRWKCEEPGINAVGYVHNTLEYIESAAVHLVTTLWEVTIPQVVLEAEASGIPTVAFDIPVFRGEKGIWLGNNVKDVVELVVDAIVNPSRYSSNECFLDIEARNSEVKCRWKGLFTALAGGAVPKYLDEGKVEYNNAEVYSKLLDEVQRSESFMVATQLPMINKIRRWKARWNHLKDIVGQ